MYLFVFSSSFVLYTVVISKKKTLQLRLATIFMQMNLHNLRIVRNKELKRLYNNIFAFAFYFCILVESYGELRERENMIFLLLFCM